MMRRLAAGLIAACVLMAPALTVAKTLDKDYDLTIAGTQPPLASLATQEQGDRQVIVGFDRQRTPYRLLPFFASITLKPYTDYQPPEAFNAPARVQGTFVAKGKGDIAYAWLANPVPVSSLALGLRNTARTLAVLMNNGKTLQFDAPEGAVFDDAYPRIVDIGRDGFDEVLVTLRTERGTAVAVFLPLQDSIKLAGITSPAAPDSWVNTVGVADVSGGAEEEILVISDPLRGGWLEVYSLQQGRLFQQARYYGYNNLTPGTTQVSGHVLANFNEDSKAELLCVRSDRQSISVIGFSESGINKLLQYNLRGTVVSNLAAQLQEEQHADRFVQAAFLLAGGTAGLLSRLPIDNSGFLQ